MYNNTILFVNTEFPYPPRGGGHVAILSRLKYLKENGATTILAAPQKGEISDHQKEKILEYCDQYIPLPISNANTLKNLFLHPLFPIRSIKRHCKYHIHILDETIQKEKVSHVVFEHTPMALMHDKVNVQKRYAFYHSLNYKSFQRIANRLPKLSLKRLLFKFESFKSSIIEKRLLESTKFTGSFFYSQDDLEEASKSHPSRKDSYHFMPLGIEKRLSTETTNNGNRILLIGSMDNPSNEDAARWMAKEIFPIVLSKLPSAQLTIVGKNAKAKISDLKTNHIAIHSDVEDIAPFLATCDAYVVPQLGGAGVRVKLLDGLSASLPIISTSIGTEAMPGFVKNVHYLHADTAQQFAQKTIRILEDKNLAKTIAKAGTVYFDENYASGVANSIFSKNLFSCE